MRKITAGGQTTLVEGWDQYTGSDIKWVLNPKRFDGTNMTDADVAAFPEIYLKDTTAGQYYRRAIEGPINVLWFNAKGDGVTDDTVAIQKAINCALTLPNKNLLFPPRVYMATSLNISPGLGLIGYGATIKQMAMQPNGTRLVTTQNTQHNSEIDSEILSITGLTFDGNSQNQGAYQGYEKEQSMMIFLNANPANKGRLRVVITDVTCKNGVSDGISIYKNTNVQINNHRAIDVFRGSPTITGGWSIVQVNNLITSGVTDPTGIDIEPDGAGFGGSLATEVTMNNAQLLDGDFDVGILNGGYFIGNNIVSSKPVFNLACYGTGFVKIMNSSFVIGKKSDLANKIQHASNITFENVKFHLTREFESDATPAEFACIHYLPSNELNAKLRLINCNFTTDGTLLAGDTTYAIHHRADISSSNGSVYVQGGNMDSGFDYGYYMIQGGTITIKDIKIEATTGIFVNRTNSYEYNVTIDNPVLSGSTPICINNSAVGSSINMIGLKIDESSNIVTTSTGLASNVYRGGRTIFGATTPIGRSVPGLINDRFKLYSPASSQDNEWVCTTSHHIAATWIPTAADPLAIKQGGNTFGAALAVGTKDANPINFLINNAVVGGVDASGNLSVVNTNGTFILHNTNSTVGTTCLIDSRAGSGITLTQIISELIGSTTQANLRFKVRTGAGTPPTGMTELLTLLGGASPSVGIGEIAPAARLHVTRTAEQIRAAYDASNYFSTQVASTGSTTLTATGTSPSVIIANNAFVNGTLFTTLTTEQVRVRYDATNYFSTTVASNGSTTFAVAGTTPVFTFNQLTNFTNGLSAPGGITASATTLNLYVATATGPGTTTTSQYLFGGASTVYLRVGVRGSTAATLTANTSHTSFIVGANAVTTAATGTHALIASSVCREPTVTSGGAAVTDVACIATSGTVTGGTNNWAVLATNAPSKFSALNLAITTVTGNTTLDSTHYTVVVNNTGTATITLPAAASNVGRIYTIKKVSAAANDVVIDGNASETIDGATTKTLTLQYSVIEIQSDGANWHIVSSYVASLTL